MTTLKEALRPSREQLQRAAARRQLMKLTRKQMDRLKFMRKEKIRVDKTILYNGCVIVCFHVTYPPSSFNNKPRTEARVGMFIGDQLAFSVPAEPRR